MEVQYERSPLFCHHCYSIGHNVSTCRWLHPQPPKDKNDRGKQIISVDIATPKPSRQNNDVGASTSANGSAWVPVSTTPTSLALTTLDIPAPSPSLNANSQLGPVSIVTLTVATSQTDVSMSSSLLSNSFSFLLHNVFDRISPEELPRVTPVLEVVSPVAHDDVHSERAE